MDKSVEMQSIIARIDALENDVKAVIQEHKANNGSWDRGCEAVTDRLALLAAWVHDKMHGIECQPDELSETYRRSMLKKIRRALRYEN